MINSQFSIAHQQLSLQAEEHFQQDSQQSECMQSQWASHGCPPPFSAAARHTTRSIITQLHLPNTLQTIFA